MLHHDEQARLASLRNLKLLDTLPSENFDRITRLASAYFSLPVSAVSLTDCDRQWFKSKVGIQHSEVPRHKAPCAEVAESCKPVIIKDMMSDNFYCDSVLATSGIRFYAGAPLVTPDGYGLGALCVLGTEPREVQEGEMAALQDLAAMVMDQIELQHAVGRIDALTGLPNRFQFVADLGDLTIQGNSQPRLISVIDLAETMQVANLARVMGASHFDNIVRRISAVLAEKAGRDRPFYHIGPTQFATIAPEGAELASHQDALVAELRELEQSIDFRMQMTPSIGLMCFEPDLTEPEDVLRALYSAVQEARSSHTGVALFSPDADSRYQHNFRLLQDFSDALRADNQLFLVFQPRMSLADGQILSAEALLRWNHPVFGPIPPSEFVPIIETSSTGRDMTEWVINAAFSKIAEWNARGFRLRLSINLSSVNLNETDFLERLSAKLAQYDVDPSQIEFELTETAMMKEAEKALDLLKAIAALGISIAIDDFGTGYSSLTRMQKLPADVVKIDRSFIAEMAEGNRERVLVHSMISLSHSLGYRVVAEGVETAEVSQLLQVMDCDEIQGFWLSRPLTGDRLMSWVLERQSEAFLQSA